MGSCLSVTRYGGGRTSATENGDVERSAGQGGEGGEGASCAEREKHGGGERVDTVVCWLYATCFLFGIDASCSSRFSSAQRIAKFVL